jgi:predicted enzyme related to lactoylglutathione lyase
MTDVRDEAAATARPEQRANSDSGFIWYELITPDPAGAKAFYDAVVGWNIDGESNFPNGYRMIGRSDGKAAGGLLPLTDEMQRHGARPTWLGYLYVEDVDASVRAIEEDGGKTFMPPFDIPDIGRVAMVADPQGAPFYIMKPAPPEDQPDGQSDVFSPTEVERCAWNELCTTNLEAARRFYPNHFGWKLGDVMPMGPMGDYQFIEQGGRMIGAMFAPPGRPPAWRFCFRVENLERSIEAVNSGGGEILFGPTEVPGGGRIIQANDPQGAFFMIIEGGQ